MFWVKEFFFVARQMEGVDCQTASRSLIQANRRSSARAKECRCGGVGVEQERLQYPKGLWLSASGALTPVLGILVFLPLKPEGHGNVDDGRDDEKR